jgi:predicted transcriptional regulator
MRDIAEMTRRFLAKRPEMAPVLFAMIDIARKQEANSGLAEFSRNWVAAQESATPRTLRSFSSAGLIEESPRGTGSGRRYYIFTDLAAIERVLRA